MTARGDAAFAKIGRRRTNGPCLLLRVGAVPLGLGLLAAVPALPHGADDHADAGGALIAASHNANYMTMQHPG